MADRIALYDNFAAINRIDPALYARYDVKRGLRNADGTGVVAGITNISDVHGYQMVDGVKTPDEGVLHLRGYNLNDLVCAADETRRFNFEEVAYLLLMGDLPTPAQLEAFIAAVDDMRELPDGFTASMIMRDTPRDIMNLLSRTILELYDHVVPPRISINRMDHPAFNRTVNSELSRTPIFSVLFSPVLTLPG